MLATSNKPLPLKQTSTWKQDEIHEFLKTHNEPMRIAFNDGSAFPRICSVWYYYSAKSTQIIAVSHQNAFINKSLKKNPHVGFEIGTNSPPYQGIRGQAKVNAIQSLGKEYLPVLLKKYLSDDFEQLQHWLMRRADQEEALVLDIEWITAWDYSHRMH